MVNTPIPHSLKSEAKKAAKILTEFTVPNAKTGPDGLIPAGILAKAKGLAIITVFKAGFLVTARGGSGIVIAKLDRENWSAPSAIGLAGLGGGFEIGLEVTDFIIILNTKSAVEAFSKGGNLTLGGNFTIAAGPLGRNVEGDIAVRSAAAIYTYSKTKGLFAGISIEGSALIERKDANKKFYGRDIRAHQILSGEVDPPDDCRDLYEVLKEHREFALRAVADLAKRQAVKQKEKLESMSEYSQYRFAVSALSFSRSKSTKSNHSSGNQPTRSSSELVLSEKATTSSPSSRRKDSWTDYPVRSQSKSSLNQDIYFFFKDPWKDIDMPAFKGAMASPVGASRSSLSNTVWAVADFTFQAQLDCDLSFHAGDRIKVTTRTKSQQDWWEGIDSAGEQGIFPANFVHIVS
ncbi:unnamed protein product [Candidula unifasciata]|uniref:SH3 domain-containing protein n=1 Tax=Candidula unifasciata TaxID=100452 RepID=A0A8S4A3C4_9EUPU|nr:unnamed protein product [Candidula unifasciata]